MQDVAVVRHRRGNAQSRLRLELLVNLVRKDLKVKYQSSALGFLWSMANPLLMLGVYSLVFGVLLPNGIPNFWVFLMSGLLVWNLFVGSAIGGAACIVGNAGLVKKVYFPRIVLPMASLGFVGFQFIVQLAVFAAFLVILSFPFFGPQLLLVIPALLVATVFSFGFSTLVAALNVRYRDVEHLLEVATLLWFWMTPIVYPVSLVQLHLPRYHLFSLYMLNPMADVVVAMQRAVYRHVAAGAHPILPTASISFYLKYLAIGGGVSLAMLVLALAVFRRSEADFAEEL